MQEIITWIIVVGAVAFFVVSFIRSLRSFKKPDHCGGCDSSCGACHSNPEIKK